MPNSTLLPNIPDVPSTSPGMKQFLRALKQNVGVLSTNESILSLIANGGGISEDYHPVFNLVQNPVFEWCQRYSTPSVTLTPGTGGYLADRWYGANFSGGTIVHSITNTGLTNIPYCYKLTPTGGDASIGAAEYVLFSQNTEGLRLRHMFRRPAVLSFYVLGSAVQGKTFSVAVRDSTYTKSFVSTFQIETENTWERKSILIPSLGTPDGTWNLNTSKGSDIVFTLSIGSNYQTPILNQWITGNYVGWVGQDNFMSATAHQIFFTGIQLEPGDIVHPVYIMPPAEELNELQRYYEKSYNIGNAPGAVAAAGITLEAMPLEDTYLSVQFKVNKRPGTQTVTFYSYTSGTAGYCYDATGGSDCPLLDYGAGETGFYCRFNYPGANRLIGFHWVGQNEV